MQYWLVKSEPDTYSYDRLVKEGKAVWDGVRNYMARNNLRAMKKGDKVFFYHSVAEKAIVGLAEVSKEAFPDPTTEDTRWLAVELIPLQKYAKPVTLEAIKKEPKLAETYLIRQGRLSVMPFSKEQFQLIEGMTK